MNNSHIFMERRMKKSFRSGSPKEVQAMTTKRFRQSHRANALIEYVVPMSVLLIAVGVLATIFDINNVIGEYFMAASGHTKDSMESGTLKTEAMASSAFGTFGNGSGGFTGFAAVTDGNGAAIPPGAVSATTPPLTGTTTTSPTTTGTQTGTTTPTTAQVTAGTTAPSTTTPTTTTGTTTTTTPTTGTEPATATASTVTIPQYGEVTGIYNGPLLRGGSRVDVAAATAGERLFIFDDERAGAIRPAPPPLVATAPATTTTTTPVDPTLATGTSTTTTTTPTDTTTTTPTTTTTTTAPVATSPTPSPAPSGSPTL